MSGTVTYADDDGSRSNQAADSPSSTGTSTRWSESARIVEGVPDRDRPHYRGSGHVHLTEVDDGHYVDPLAPGHIGPYTDHTTPRVTATHFVTMNRQDGLPNLVRGR